MCDNAPVADLVEKLFRLVNEFERRELRVDVGESKGMRCSKYRNVAQIFVRLGVR